jgi:hypothetical protein
MVSSVWYSESVEGRPAEAMLLDKTKGVLHQAIEVLGGHRTGGRVFRECGDIQAPG